MFVFLDESGQFEKSSDGEFFVVGSFITNDPKRIEQGFRQWQRSKFPKRMRSQTEVKWKDNSIDPKLRLRTVERISMLDVRIRFTYLRRGNIPDDFISKGRIERGQLYTQVIGETLELYLPSSERTFRVFCDQRHLKGITRSEFTRLITARVSPGLSAGAHIQVEMLDSTSSVNIQVADWITGAIAWYLEGKPYGAQCFELLKNNLLDPGVELFKSHWDVESKNPTDG